MLNHEHIRTSVKAIEKYRKAFWEHSDPQFVKDKRYRSLVSHHHTVVGDKESYFTVSLYDTWIDFDRPAHFFLGKELVKQFTSTNLSTALQEMLTFARVQLMSDQLFENNQM